MDGHHRVSVAREQGQEFIDAEVRECATRVNILAALKPEDLEIIGKTRLFTGEQIREMATRGEIDDGWVFAGLALAGFRF